MRHFIYSVLSFVLTVGALICITSDVDNALEKTIGLMVFALFCEIQVMHESNKKQIKTEE